MKARGYNCIKTKSYQLPGRVHEHEYLWFINGGITWHVLVVDNNTINASSMIQQRIVTISICIINAEHSF